MKLYYAQVVNCFDLGQRGVFQAYCRDVHDSPFEVTYATPYAVQNEAGMVAVPEEGTMILICQPDNIDKWFYLGATFERPMEQGTNRVFDTTYRYPDKNITRTRGRPQKVVLQDIKGNKLTLSNEYSPKYVNIKAQLESSLGKKLTLSDSPDKSCILLKNEHGDGLKITTRPDVVSAARSIELESRGPHRYISRDSEIEIRVNDGKEITIENNSTGIKMDTTAPQQYGNINLTSGFRDINLTTKGAAGRIFLDSLGPGGHIQIDSEGTITIWSRGPAKIKCGSLDIKSDSSVNIEATTSLSLKAGGVVNIQGSNTNIGGDNTVSIEGPSRIDLNKGSRVSAPPANVTETDRLPNNYGI